MSKSAACCSLRAAAAKHADVKAKAAGNGALQLEPKQMIMGKVTEAETRYRCATPQEDEASFHEALLSAGECGEVSEYGEEHMAVAATTRAAALIKTGVVGAPAAYRNLDSLAPTVSAA